MIKFSNGGRLIQDASELPDVPRHVQRLYLDFETTSRDNKKDSLNPWRDCWAAGYAFTWDDMREAYYLPVGHRDLRWNLPRDVAIAYLRRLFASTRTWVNHHIKYDSHVAYNDLGVDFDGERICTIVRSKILDSDRQYRGGYGLDVLSRDLLGKDISQYEHALRAYLANSKDYGIVAADVMGEYACQDVFTNRELDYYLIEKMPAESSPVVETETKLTSLLVRMERRGLLVKPQELLEQKLYTLSEMVGLEQSLHKAVGYPFIPTSSNDCFDVLCNHYGLPVISWTEGKEDEDGTVHGGGNPSFDAETLEKYLNRIDAPTAVVEQMIRYRKLSTFKGLFVETFLDLAEPIGDGVHAVVHPEHNQCVRTGRMSCKRPNSQQQNEQSKKLFHPGDGMSYFSADGSQIEFRTIVHYIQDAEAIREYNENPDVDFHQRVADMCGGISRRPAKTINFSVAFGQGKAATVDALSVDKDLVVIIKKHIEDLIAMGELRPEGKEQAFKALARKRGEALYDTYHDTFPGIRRTARQAMNACLARGYVRNVRGRRRYLPKEQAHKAFNNLNQSSAADIMKERMVALDEAYRGTGVKELEVVTQVHDEILSVGPTEVMQDPRFARDCIAILEDVKILRVPLRFKYGIDDQNWMRACKEPAKGGAGDLSMPLDQIKQAQGLAWLR